MKPEDLQDVCISDLDCADPVLVIDGTKIRVLDIYRDHQTCGDGCCSWISYEIKDLLSNDTVNEYTTVIPISNITPEWQEFLRANEIDPSTLDQNPLNLL